MSGTRFRDRLDQPRRDTQVATKAFDRAQIKLRGQVQAKSAGILAPKPESSLFNVDIWDQTWVQ